MKCPACNGGGCDECEHGRIEIECCPLELLSFEIYHAIRAAELYEKGLPLVAGGQLDQPVKFIEVSHFIISERNAWKNQLGILW